MKVLVKMVILLTTIVLLLSQFSFVYADGEQQESSLDLNNVVTGADKALRRATRETEDEEQYINTEGLAEYSKQIFNTLFIIGVILSVGFGGYIGIKFMIASAEDKAKIKEVMIPYIIGCIVIFGAYGIWSLTVKTLNIVS